MKKFPGAGLTSILANTNVKFIIPGTIASPAGSDSTVQIIFPQSVRKPACVACDQVAVADVAYSFSYPDGKFLDTHLVKVQ